MQWGIECHVPAWWVGWRGLDILLRGRASARGYGSSIRPSLRRQARSRGFQPRLLRRLLLDLRKTSKPLHPLCPCLVVCRVAEAFCSRYGNVSRGTVGCAGLELSRVLCGREVQSVIDCRHCWWAGEAWIFCFVDVPQPEATALQSVQACAGRLGAADFSPACCAGSSLTYAKHPSLSSQMAECCWHAE